MSRHTKPTHLNIWQLVHLGHELEEVAFKLNMLAAQFKRGAVDHRLYEAARGLTKPCTSTKPCSKPRRPQ